MIGKRPCRECREPCHPANRWQLCPACRLSFCQTCGVRLPRDRQGRQCQACHRVGKEKLYSRVHPCKDCGQPLPAGLRTELCRPCREVEYEYYCSLPSRPCKECGQPMPAGRRTCRCTDCYRIWRKKRDKENGLVWCAACGQHVRAAYSSYCRTCAGIRSTWRRQYLQGDPMAKLLRPKRTNKRRQKLLKEEG